MLITFEGIDASGKTTQAKKLAERLKNLNCQVVLTREPGDTNISKEIRNILLYKSSGPISWLTELFLYMADRAQHTEELIRPKLQEGKIVICDRYVDSTLAYQGYARGLDVRSLLELNRIATAEIKPEITFLIDLPPEIALKRKHTHDRLEKEGLEFQRRVREGYLKLAKIEPRRFYLIDGTGEIQSTSKKIFEIAKPKIVKSQTQRLRKS